MEQRKRLLLIVQKNGVKLTSGQTSVIIKFEDQTVEQKITVKGKSAVDISVKKLPTKTTYIQYEEGFDLAGGILLVKYNDGSSEEVPLEEVAVDGFDNTKIGKVTLNARYLGLVTTFELEIIAKVQELPENSDFSKAVVKNKLMKIYYYTNSSNKEYALINIEITGIQKATVNDSLSYEYYLSSNQKRILFQKILG